MENFHIPVGMRLAHRDGAQRAVLEADRDARHHRLGKLALGCGLKLIIGEQGNTLTEISTYSATEQSGITGRRATLERK